MRQIHIFMPVLTALIVVSVVFCGCIHESGQEPPGDRVINGLYIYEVMVMPGAPVTNLTLMVPLPSLDGVSTVADAVEHGEGMDVPPGWSIMIIDGDDAVFLKIDAAEAEMCGSAVSSGEAPDEYAPFSSGREITTDPACRFGVAVPAHISVPGSSPVVNNPLLYPKTGIEMQNGDDGVSVRPVPAPLLSAVSYRSLVYARYDTSENTRLCGYVIVTGVILKGTSLSGDTSPGSYKTVYTDEIMLDLTGSQAGWHLSLIHI
jgi:hypothetical protein